VVGSLVKTPFEVRKQLIQMYNHNVSIRDISYLTRVTCFPLICRDVLFRQMMLGVYYLTTSIEHKPLLKYSVPQITDFMKQRRAMTAMQGLPQESVHDLSYVFYEFHNYEIKTKITTRLTFLILANLLATVLTNPIDVCVSKMAT